MAKDVIAGLEPQLLWNYFYEISQVPRPSKKEEKIVEYIKKLAADNNLECKVDAVGNTVVKVPATPGYENAPIVVLQGHVDMVCEKNKGTEHDFDNDPIKLVKDGDWLQAEGTTLGADNGIGVAAGIAIAMDKEAVHGPLELLNTIDEETGMTGVNALQPGFIEGKILLNLDSEEDGEFYVGCAGGQDTVGIFNIKRAKVKKDWIPYELMVTGLKGGHSGMEIDSGKANAIKILGRLLKELEEVKYRIADINGGSKRNAIPREAEATILLKEGSEAKVKEMIAKFTGEILEEIKTVDGGLEIKLTPKEEKYEKAFAKKFTRRLVRALLAMPHGVIAMSADIPGLVETSTNLATLFTEGDIVRLGTSQRSSIEGAKMYIANSVASVLELAQADEVRVGDGYPGWKPNMDSAILKFSKEVYKEMFGKEPEVKAIHAGLECGILGTKYDGLDMMSFGPTITGAHSPDEQVNIPDTDKFYKLLKGILAKLAERK